MNSLSKPVSITRYGRPEIVRGLFCDEKCYQEHFVYRASHPIVNSSVSVEEDSITSMLCANCAGDLCKATVTRG